MKYKLINENGQADLEAAVNAALEDGWLLAGGASVSGFSYHNAREGYDETCVIFAQAMVKPVEAEPKP